ncbi:DUF6580 family putative transport protein [Solitalea koreensis]|uniref:Rod shape-determining protein MreD n=1 Tax=Solitalea koreensis TaxID=543615 RepID=A0A521BD40_9SPHI|nr:DUF6580 family putative transport protein [Solitalea koreensis]SMO44993.1 hypothetical protein SAMN06265350_102106 [Solitalea koreensis]
MENKLINPRFAVVTLIIIAASITRFIPHPPNFTAIGSLALFGGAMYSDKRLAIIMPLLAMAISDLFIPSGFLPSVYFSFACIVLIGFLMRNKVGIANVAVATVTSAVLFFVVSNFFMWYSGTLYPKTNAGLMVCYVAAIPFFWNMLAGTAFFSALFFGGFYLLEKRFPVLAVK